MIKAVLGLRHCQSLFQICLELIGDLLLRKIEVGGFSRLLLPFSDDLQRARSIPLCEKLVFDRRQQRSEPL